MKITFIYDYKQNEIWSTPLSLVNQFIKIGWETEIISINAGDYILQKWIEEEYTSDIVLFMDWGRFDSVWLNKKYKPNSFWIQESGDDPQNFERNYPKANKFHYTITPDKNSAEEYKRRGIKSEWITHWADTAIQFPLDIEPQYVAVTSRGLGGSEFLDYLTNWAEGGIGNRNNMDAIEHTKFLNSGLMVIQNSRWGEITRRLFEGMACGKLVLTDRLSESTGLYKIFIEGQDIVYYDNIVDCMEKINYYNEHTEERENIAKSGMLKVLNDYTQINVVNKIINAWKNFQSV